MLLGQGLVLSVALSSASPGGPEVTQGKETERISGHATRNEALVQLTKRLQCCDVESLAIAKRIALKRKYGEGLNVINARGGMQHTET
jgi:hypothetical protein